jgi:hypothetical protein
MVLVRSNKGIPLDLKFNPARLPCPIAELDAHNYEEEVLVDPPASAAGPLGPPVAALFDGLPMAQHDRLRDRLAIDDPDDFAASYGAAGEQIHGTSMASLIVHGRPCAPGASGHFAPDEAARRNASAGYMPEHILVGTAAVWRTSPR